MFTGIINAKGVLVGRRHQRDDARLEFETPSGFLQGIEEGDSIAVSGVCLTALELENTRFSADVSGETLACTTLGQWSEGREVNLELALRAADRLGGHLVSGHVDGVGELLSDEPEGESRRLVFKVPVELARYVASKGSICIDGISLTVNEVRDDPVAGCSFGVNIIPHTMEVTTFGGLKPGDRVNLEVDMIARYLERLQSRG
jgi:riboflavin synthase